MKDFAAASPFGPAEFIAVEGMTCASCVSRVEKALAGVPGVVAASVNLATERATIRVLDKSPALTAAIEAAVRRADCEPRAVLTEGADKSAARAAEQRRLRRDFLIAVALTLPIFVLEMGRHLIPGPHMWLGMTVGDTPLYIFYFLLATTVQFGPGLRSYRKGLPALWYFSPDMNSLVVVGSSAAWAYSVVATFAPGLLPAGTANVYFEASSVIVTLILMGRYLEAKARGHTSQAISRVVGLQAKSARVLRGSEVVEVVLEAVRPGDVIQIRPGDRLSVDGTVLTGTSYVDEAMISGEPVPVLKEAGAAVTGARSTPSGPSPTGPKRFAPT